MIKVVVVDDETIQRRGIISMTPWESCGCKVVGEADNAAEALEIVKLVQPDIIVTDIKMPKMSGLEMIAALCREIQCEFIVISGYGEFSYAKQALELGVRNYLLKPVDDQELLEAIKSAVFRVQERRSVEKLKTLYRSGKVNGEWADHFGAGKTTDRYLEQAIHYIEKNCDKNLTVKDVASTLYISGSYLLKLFASQMSYSFNEYLTLCRIRRAVQYLKNEDMKIYEIAEACGYKDTRYFSALFRKIVGVTPTEYRQGKMG